MKKFTLYIALFIGVYLTLLEITTRIFNLSGHTLKQKVIDGKKLFEPNNSGVWVHGGLGEIQANYKINSNGYNSLKEYDIQNSDKKYLAVVGDSYIAGYHTNAYQSIGRQLEVLYGGSDSIEVHEYGIPSANAIDFLNIVHELDIDNYDYIYVLISETDLKPRRPEVTQLHEKKEFNSDKVILVLENLSLYRYLILNQRIRIKLGLLKRKLVNFFSTNARINIINKPDYSILEEFPETTFFLYQNFGLKPDSSTIAKNRFIEIHHVRKPYNFGFDSHWNLNGRINCANSIYNHLVLMDD